jgi:hypothetical protein
VTRPFQQTYSLATRGNPGLACDDDGLALGPAILAKAVRDAEGHRRYQSRPAEDMAQLLRLAYGPVPDRVMGRWCLGLARVTQLLAEGEAARACIHAVLLGFPEIAHEGMAKLAHAANLRKYGDAWEDEPRVPAGNPDGGQWTTDGSVQIATQGWCDGSDDTGEHELSWGTTLMFIINQKDLCYNCAIKELRLQDAPSSERARILGRYINCGE